MKYLLSFALVLILTGCSLNEFSSEMPSVPDSVEIDLNEDGINDFVVKFSIVDIDSFDEDHGGTGIVGSIDPSNSNQVLLKKDKGNLFLRKTEDIKESVDAPLSWSKAGFSKQLLFIHNNSDGEWQNKWKIDSDSNHSSYFLGLKIVNDNSTQLGWVELDINKKDGTVKVVKKGIL